MRKQFLLISTVVLLAGTSAMMLSRKADKASGSFTLETEKDNNGNHISKAQTYADAAKWRLDRLKDENGNYYPGYMANAIQQANNYSSISRSNGLGLQWQELGPDNVGGRTRAILIDKRDSSNNTIYAGGVSGGMWKSTDGANTWTRLPAFDNWIAIASIAQAPAPDYSIYIGTGVGLDGTYSAGTSLASCQYGNGIFKIDGSSGSDNAVLITPTVMPANLYNPGSGSPWFEVNRIAVNQTNPSQIIAGTMRGLYTSTNAGLSWAKLPVGTALLNLDTNNMVDDVKWSNDGKNIFVSFGGTLIFSNNGGTTWAEEGSTNTGFPAGGASRIEVAIAPSNSSVVYALMASGTGGTKGVYKSSDAGHTWSAIAIGGPLFLLFEEPNTSGGGQGEYDNTIAVSPADPDKFYMGGVNFYTGSATSGVKASDSYGGNPSNPYALQADKHTIVIADNNPDLMFIGCDGGIYESTDALSAFPNPTYNPKNRGYNVTQNYGIGAGLDGSVIGGSQDNGTNYIDYYGSSFGASKEVLGGDGFENAVSQIDPNYYFGAIYYAALFRSSDHAATFGGYFDVKVDPLGQGGATVCGAQSVGADAQFCTPYYLSETKNALNGIRKVPFVASDRAHTAGEVVSVTSETAKYQFDVTLSQNIDSGSSILVDDPIRSRIFMSTACGVFLTSDALDITIIPRWFKLTPAINGNAEWFASTADGNNLYLCTDQGYVYKFSNLNAHADTATYPAGTSVGQLYTSTSPDISKTLVASGRILEGIDVDPADNNHLVVTVAGFSTSATQPHVYESHDGGATWVADTAGLPNMPV